ncbi:MAG: hypothetical protein NT136_03030 [Candidatus Moranbacteria bacterium]|nr:hypothetical protein [Candidatus Moranbacteria bacterium]
MLDKSKIFDPYVSSYFGRIHDVENLEESYEIFFRYYRKNLEKFLPLSKSAKIVDLGCSIGQLLYFFKKAMARTVQNLSWDVVGRRINEVYQIL